MMQRFGAAAADRAPVAGAEGASTARGVLRRRSADIAWRSRPAVRAAAATTPFRVHVERPECCSARSWHVRRCSILKLDPCPTVITFDCYGTLVQWHRAVRQAAQAILDTHLQAASPPDRVIALADRLREVAVEHQQRPPFREYRSVLHASLGEALAEAGHTATAADQDTLASVLGRIEPHPEVPGVLARLRERYRIAIISNTDDDLIAATVDAIGTPVDFVVTAQQARAYKPDHQLFL